MGCSSASASVSRIRTKRLASRTARKLSTMDELLHGVCAEAEVVSDLVDGQQRWWELTCGLGSRQDRFPLERWGSAALVRDGLSGTRRSGFPLATTSGIGRMAGPPEWYFAVAPGWGLEPHSLPVGLSYGVQANPRAAPGATGYRAGAHSISTRPSAQPRATVPGGAVDGDRGDEAADERPLLVQGGRSSPPGPPARVTGAEMRRDHRQVGVQPALLRGEFVLRGLPFSGRRSRLARRAGEFASLPVDAVRAITSRARSASWSSSAWASRNSGSRGGRTVPRSRTPPPRGA